MEISYDEIIHTDDGEMEWIFPMVVGPRFMPSYQKEPLTQPDYQLNPTRDSNTISLSLVIQQAGSIHAFSSSTHAIQSHRGHKNISIDLNTKKDIPNKDFVLTVFI